MAENEAIQEDDALLAEEKVVESSIATHAAEIPLDQPFPNEITAPTPHIADAPTQESALPATTTVEPIKLSPIKRLLSIFHKHSKPPAEADSK